MARPAPIDPRARAAVERILNRGGVTTLGTERARAAWSDVVAEAAVAIIPLLTEWELAAIVEGAE